MSDGTAPLAGLRVLELSRILAGPWAGQLLADLGADVIKIESPQGDDTRRWGPPFVENADGSRDAAYFHAANRGKRSVVIDFSTSEGADEVRRLARREVDDDGPLAAIRRMEISCVAAAVRVLDERWAPAPCVVALRTLDLDDVGAEIRQKLTGPRARENPR